MPRPKCPACGHHEFEAIPIVNKTGQKFCLVQCVTCGTVVGAIDDVRVASVVRKAERKLVHFIEKFTPVVAAIRKKNEKN